MGGSTQRPEALLVVCDKPTSSNAREGSAG